MEKEIQLVARIYNDLWNKHSNGMIIPDVVFDAFKEEVEQWLGEIHAQENPEVLDDDMPDHFDTWIQMKLEEHPFLGTIIN